MTPDVLIYANQECSSIRYFILGFPLLLSFFFSYISLFLLLFSTQGFSSPPLSTSPAPWYLCPFCVFSFTSSLKSLHRSFFSYLLLFFLTIAFSCFSAFLLLIIFWWFMVNPTQFSNPVFSFYKMGIYTVRPRRRKRKKSIQQVKTPKIFFSY